MCSDGNRLISATEVFAWKTPTSAARRRRGGGAGREETTASSRPLRMSMRLEPQAPTKTASARASPARTFPGMAMENSRSAAALIRAMLNRLREQCAPKSTSGEHRTPPPISDRRCRLLPSEMHSVVTDG